MSGGLHVIEAFAGPMEPQLMLSRFAKYVNDVVFSTMFTDATASGLNAFLPAIVDLSAGTSFFLGVETSVGKATFISMVFGPASWGDSVTVDAIFVDSLPQLLSQCRLQSPSTQSTPQVPSVTHDPHANACWLQALASSLSNGFPTKLVAGATAAAPLGMGLAQSAGVAAVGGCAAAQAVRV
jgi:hypothetical protein